MKANWLSNGLGGQSMMLLHLACIKKIPATVSITSDTGSEMDRVCSTGERMSAHEFFHRHVHPYAKANGIEAVMVRAVDKNKALLGSVLDRLKEMQGVTFKDLTKRCSVPLFTNDKTAGRLIQSCTSKWKVSAINQEAKRRKISHLRLAVGFHSGECHRLKARFKHTDGGFSIYQSYRKEKGELVDVKWLEHYYPLIDLGLNRQAIRKALDDQEIPYLITTECDCCPHQDYHRWMAHTPEVLNEMAELESRWKGKLFFTDERIPLKEALAVKKLKLDQKAAQQDLFSGFACEDGAYCGI